jgi:hypothetical protein
MSAQSIASGKPTHHSGAKYRRRRAAISVSTEQRTGGAAMYNDLTQTPILATQTKLDELEFRLQGQFSGRVVDFHVLNLRGGIVLRGFTRTYYHKQLAQQAVMNLTDLPILANEIEVY